MKTEFVTYEQALALKELGFDEPCLKTMLDFDITYESNIKMPLKQQVFRWFRNKYRFSHNICDWLDDYEFIIFEWTLSEDRIVHTFELRFDTYEEAESACIDELIEIVKNK